MLTDDGLGTGEIDRFVDWLYGKEADATHGPAARFIQQHVTTRPAEHSGHPPRWESFAQLRAAVQTSGPACSLEELNGSIAAFRAPAPSAAGNQHKSSEPATAARAS